MAKQIIARTMVELIAKVYAAEGWTHRIGEVKTKRVQSAYAVAIDTKRNLYMAKRKASVLG